MFCDTRWCLFRCWTSKLWCSTRIYLKGSLLFLQYINDLSQALNKIWSYLYANDACIFCQDEDIEKESLKEFSSLCEWFIDNKLPIHFGDDKT